VTANVLATNPSSGLRRTCPPWCRRHLDGGHDGVDVHQAVVGRAGGHTIEIWQADAPGEPVRATVVDEQHTELLTVDIEHAAALGALLSAAAIATR